MSVECQVSVSMRPIVSSSKQKRYSLFVSGPQGLPGQPRPRGHRGKTGPPGFGKNGSPGRRSPRGKPGKGSNVNVTEIENLLEILKTYTVQRI